MPCYLSGAPVGGHPSISDDGSGNVEIAAGKDLHLVGTGGRIRVPAGNSSDVSVQNNVTPSTGLDLGGNPAIYRGATSCFAAVSATAHVQGQYAKITPELILGVATVNITGVGTLVSISAPLMKLSPDGVYTLTNALNGVADGNFVILENISAFALTLQEGPVIAAGGFVTMLYSADVGAWSQV